MLLHLKFVFVFFFSVFWFFVSFILRKLLIQFKTYCLAFEMWKVIANIFYECGMNKIGSFCFQFILHKYKCALDDIISKWYVCLFCCTQTVISFVFVLFDLCRCCWALFIHQWYFFKSIFYSMFVFYIHSIGFYSN